MDRPNNRTTACISLEEDGMCRTVDKSKLDLYRPEEMAMKVWPVVLEFMN